MNVNSEPIKENISFIEKTEELKKEAEYFEEKLSITKRNSKKDTINNIQNESLISQTFDQKQSHLVKDSVTTCDEIKPILKSSEKESVDSKV